MTRLEDILDIDRLNQHIENKNIYVRYHPTLPLKIYNYAPKCTFKDIWDNVTIQCRGLIANNNNIVIARPFKKFFNYGNKHAATIKDNLVVTDKIDGSLGILYPANNGYAISTRGSFVSEQALHANKIWQKYYSQIQVPDDLTLLFEIVYPENRIVVNYDKLDDLILLGAIEISTGNNIQPKDLSKIWPGQITHQFSYKTLEETINAKPRPNAEGFVLYSLDTNERVKLKQEDYFRLHKIITELTGRSVWQYLVDKKPIEDLLDILPEEFHLWVKETVQYFIDEVKRQTIDIEFIYKQIIDNLPENSTRREFAIKAANYPFKWALFNKLDGKDYKDKLLKLMKPETNWTPNPVFE